MIYVANLLIAFGVFFLCFGYMVTKHTFSEKIDCWGKRVPIDTSIKKARKIWLFALVGLLIGVVLWIVALCEAMWEWDFNYMLYMIFPIVLSLLPIPFGITIGEKWVIKKIQTTRNALCLDEFLPLQVVNDNFEKTAGIEIFRNGIVLYDNTGFAFERIIFETYSLGNFSDAKQMIILASYFLQKYPFVFKTKFNESSSLTRPTGNTATDFGSSVGTLVASASGSGMISIKLSQK